jgi:rhodanese-related sulfurtransferase
MLTASEQLLTQTRKDIQEVSWEQLAADPGQDRIIIDVREPAEFEAKTYPGSLNIPRGLLEFTIDKHPELEHMDENSLLNSRVYLFCQTGGRSALAAKTLQNLGFKHVFSMKGGLELKG